MRKCAEEVRRFGIASKVALPSYSNFGPNRQVSPQKMRKAKEFLEKKALHLEVEGEMHAENREIVQLQLAA